MLKSIWDNSIWYRIITLIVWLSFLFWLNYLLFAPYMWIKYNYTEVFLVIFLWLTLFYLIKMFKYEYTIKDNALFIKWPFKYYKIPFSDIEKVWEIKNIPLHYKVGMKFNPISKILYLCGYVNNWIILKLQTHDIVICPRKYKDFFEKLKNR